MKNIRTYILVVLGFLPSLLAAVDWVLPSQFPNDFLCGTAVAEYQVSGRDNCLDSNWARWEEAGHIKDRILSGTACDFWHKYPEDIARMKYELGVNALRISLEWSAVEPKKGIFCQEAIDHYHEVIDRLLEAQITPMVTLHHFTDPVWFAQCGGFENEENIIYFVRFCSKMFEEFGHKVRLWCTINEPTIYVLSGYLRGVFPPGKIMNISCAWKVLKNLMIAHTRVYQHIKQQRYGQEAQVGLVHQYLKFQAYHWWNPLEHVPGLFFNQMMNDSVLEFCKTGIFKISLAHNIKTIANVSLGLFAYAQAQQFHLSPSNSAVAGLTAYALADYITNYCDAYSYDAHYKQPLDFLGLNYYTCVRPKCELSITEPIKPACYADKGEVMTDMPYGTCPDGLYEAIAACSEIGVPIYITENGIADAKDDRRAKFIEDYVDSLLRAIGDGFDVRGYFYWSFMDNLEWDMGFEQKFGLYEVDFKSPEKTRKLRGGAQPFLDFAKAVKITSDLSNTAIKA